MLQAGGQAQTSRQTDRQEGKAGRQTDKRMDRQTKNIDSQINPAPFVPDSQRRPNMACEQEIPSCTGHDRIQAPVMYAVALNHIQASPCVKYTQGCSLSI